jgi:hypothetical protein
MIYNALRYDVISKLPPDLQSKLTSFPSRVARVIVTGDFNSDPADQPFQWLLGQRELPTVTPHAFRFQNAYSTSDPSATAFTYADPYQQVRVDHIVCTPDTCVSEACLPGLFNIYRCGKSLIRKKMTVTNKFQITFPQHSLFPKNDQFKMIISWKKELGQMRFA